MPLPQPTEKAIERSCIKLYEQFGCKILKFSQPFKAAQTQGIPDLKVYFPRLRKTWWHEVKRPKGKMSQYQELVREIVTSCDEHHYVGGINTAIEALNNECNIRLEKLPE